MLADSGSTANLESDHQTEGMEKKPYAAGFLKLRKIMIAGKGALIQETNNSALSIKIDGCIQNETPKGF